MKAFTAASLLHCFILQWLSKLWNLLCELCACLQIYMLKFNMVSEPQRTRHFSSSDLLLDHFLFCRYNFEMNSSIPLLTRSSDYFEWKVKMFVFLNRQDVYWVSEGFDRDYFESENDWLNACDAYFGIMKLSLSPGLRYLSRSIKDPQELWTRLDRTFGMIDEDHNSTLERTYSTISILDPKISAFTLPNEVFQDE